MNMLFVQEAVYVEYEDHLYSQRIEYGKYWNRFLSNFRNVTVLARVKKVNELPSGFKRSTGPGINFIGLPFYNGPFEYFRKRKLIKQIIKDAVNQHEAVVIRIPGPLGALTARECVKRNLKFVVEVVGDPYEVGKFLPISWPFRTYLKYSSFWEMKKIVSKASAALYVTKNVLQNRYPPAKNAITSYASNVIISSADILLNKKARLEKIGTIETRLHDFSKIGIKIGVLGMVYSIKSPLEIVKTAKILLDSGFNIQIEFVGNGPLIADIKKLSTILKIADRVICFGAVSSGDRVTEFLDSIDIYLQFSKTEGLPRAMIEAMSRGCPVIASNVGGIPELISEDLLVKSCDYVSLSKKIMWFLSKPDKMKIESEININKAKEFSDEVLSVRRNEFYSQVVKIYQKDGK
jgi:glycosyltransferase involved in cell wall biosynthesis